MATTKRLIPYCILMSILLCSLVPSSSSSSSSSSSQSCSNFIFPDNKVFFTTCADLPVSNSFLHWTYNPSSRTLQIAYRQSQVASSSWVAWGINPTSTGMAGTQAIVAYQKPDGNMAVYTSPIDGYETQLQEGKLTFPVSDLSASFVHDEIILFATIELPNNGSSFHHVWQDGPVLGDNLGMHELSGHHLQSMGTLNISSGLALASHGGSLRTKIKITHGALNTVSWGIMMPLGFMAARYLKAVGPRADPLWFYLHISLQLPAYIIGLIGGGVTGILLMMGKSSGIHHPCHMGIGITLFILGLLQVSAIVVRPGKDHKDRHIWNWFHHITGYTVLILSFTNIWLGFNILKPAKGWVISYGAVFGALILATVLLEVWKRLTRDGKMINGTNEVNKTCTPPENNV